MALLALPNVDHVFQTATLTSFVTRDRRPLSRYAVAAALGVEHMKLASFAIEERSRAVDAWIVDTTGLGCAMRAREIRAVLVALPDVVDAFVERTSMVLHVVPGTEVTAARLASPLTGYDVGIGHLRKDPTYRFGAE